MNYSPTYFFKTKPFIFTVLFLILLLIFENLRFPQTNANFILRTHLAQSNYVNLFTFLLLTTISVLLAACFFWVAFSSSFKYKIIYFLFFCIAILAEYSYQNVFGRYIEIEDFENAFIAADFAIQKNAFFMYLSYLAIIPCLIFGILLFFSKPIIKKEWSGFLFLLISFITFFSISGYFTSNLYHSISLSAFYRTIISIPVNYYFGSSYQAPRYLFNGSRQEVAFHSDHPPKNNIVFIVDESIRGDHLSLNGYERETTPYLDQLNKKGFIKNWGLAASGTTCSKSSNNLMLTGVNKVPDLNFRVYELPTIFQYAKSMGYKTHYFDGQVSQLWNGKTADIKNFGEWLTSKDWKAQNHYDVDAEIANKIKDITANSNGNFIWVNKSGVHNPYHNSYPESESIWQSKSSNSYVTNTYDSNENKESIKNNYDNAIKFNSQSFFTSLFNNDEVLPNTFYIYTSDHGQTLSENGEIVSHCSNTRNEAIVPLFIIGNSAKLNNIDTGFKASHANLFATLLDLMDFPENERKYNYSISLLKAKTSDSQPRFYYAGDLFSISRGKEYPFDQ